MASGSCPECGRDLGTHHTNDRDGLWWCTEDGAAKGYGHYYDPSEEEAGIVLSLGEFPPPCDGCGKHSDVLWPSPFDGLFHLCGECVGVVPGVAA